MGTTWEPPMVSTSSSTCTAPTITPTIQQINSKNIQPDQPIVSSSEDSTPRIQPTSEQTEIPDGYQPPNLDANMEVSPGHEGENQHRVPEMLDLSTAGLCHSSRSQKPSGKVLESKDKTVRNIFGFFMILLCATACLGQNALSVPTTLQEKAIYHAKVATSLFDKTINSFHPMAFAANQQQNKTYTYCDMLQLTDSKDSILAMLKEVDVHEGRNHWTLMLQDDIPPDKLVDGQLKTIMSIWSFKWKRCPSGELMKHKA
eukprot:9995043-Ditylum_brightwellii.AAC.2